MERIPHISYERLMVDSEGLFRMATSLGGLLFSICKTIHPALLQIHVIQPNWLLTLCMMGLSHVALTLGQLMQQQSDPCQGQKARDGSVFWMRKMTRHCGKP